MNSLQERETIGKKAVVAGHICLDITPLFPVRETKRLEEVLMPGKLLHMNGVDVHTGGAVANTGLAMLKLGTDVSLQGKIGDDEFGKLVIEILKENGYRRTEDMIIEKGVKTSYTVILAPPGVDRIFLHDPGANDNFAYEDLNWERIRDARLFHFGYPPLMRKLYQDDGAELVRIFEKVKSYETATSLDLASVDPGSEAGRKDWRKILQRVVPHTDFLLPSVEELCFMLDPARYSEWTKRAGGADITAVIDTEKDVRPLTDQLLDMGAKVIVIKCGAPGLYYRTGSLEMMEQVGKKAGIDAALWANKEGFERSYVPEKVLSGTGAGDTSIAAFLTAILEKRTIEDCIRLAAATGASCVEGYDALSGLQSFAKLEEKIAKGWKKLTAPF